MSKSILLIDTPESCRDCKLMFIDTYSHYCGITQCDVYDYYFDGIIPDSCPLRPLPEKYEIDRSKCSDPFYEFEFEYGYNQCVDEILGE